MKSRVVSAAVLLAIVFLCVFLSPVTRVLFFAVTAGLCAYELSVNLEKLDIRCTLWVMFVYIALQTVLTLAGADNTWYIACFVLCVFLALFSGVLHSRVSGRGALGTLSGLCYPCLLFSLLMVISVSDIWAQSLLLAAFSTWVCDSFALFGGMRFGRHKLAPLVSPNKTVEGSVCGAIASLAAGLGVYFLLGALGKSVALWVCLITALIASSLGQIGDLAESLIKRTIGVKDFSNLIPGHGGMLDRADSLLFSIPTAYLCLRLAALL